MTDSNATRYAIGAAVGFIGATLFWATIFTG
jgi:hypothetical protein